VKSVAAGPENGIRASALPTDLDHWGSEIGGHDAPLARRRRPYAPIGAPERQIAGAGGEIQHPKTGLEIGELEQVPLPSAMKAE
jgi:hypothetical protein